MVPSTHIALCFFAAKTSDFLYTIYRRLLSDSQQSVVNTRFLPNDCLSRKSDENPVKRYEVSLVPLEQFDEVQIRSWVNPDLTVEVLHQALVKTIQKNNLTAKTEVLEKFTRKVAFTLRCHSEVREVMWLRAYSLRSLGRFGFLCNFSLRVPHDSPILPKSRLELSLTHKNGRLNEDFFLDHYQKVGDFINEYFDFIQILRLHDGTNIELEKKLSVLPSFTLSTRTYIFGNNREGKNQFFGLRDNGPFLGVDPAARLVFVFRAIDRSKSQDLFRALRGDTYSTFSGMEKIFRVAIGKQNVSGIEVKDFSDEELQKVCAELRIRYPHGQVLPIAIVPMSKHTSEEDTQNYFKAKYVFLSNGFASQFVDKSKRMEDRNGLKWSISNIGLALFAKINGIPWHVKPSTERCLIVGIGQAHKCIDDKIEKYVAYSVLTDSSGIYETIRILGRSTNHNEYLDSLKTNLRQVLLSHKDQYDSFVLHMTFSMKKDEIKAILLLLKELKAGPASECEFAAIKFNNHNSFFGFSTEHNSRIPYEGTVTPLSKTDFLIWFSGIGIVDSKAPKKPERPVHLRVLYPETGLGEADLKRLLQDAMNIAGANWRGFNATSMPISVYYAKIIADYYANFRKANLPEIDMDNLPPWFL